ncbi:L-aminoadipate-semialdehyde dehydrogenase large subunit [Orchesella cincta]|uniref:L-aminoadipate-semialdehyde dehydrogenase large subunit n=1 Tax=Orchesella cincta TaxID=48709 RepID=A0A1D2MJL1_ORCCI|nr:L-aminoadipate-semialdehyde dehydrogenase large subunit [Orchesella cincta]
MISLFRAFPNGVSVCSQILTRRSVHHNAGVKFQGSVVTRRREKFETNNHWTSENVNELIREDSELPGHIRAKSNQFIKEIGDTKTVLLLGSTGTMGPYFLETLCNMEQISNVVCLMRGNNDVVYRNLKSWQHVKTENLHKVTCVNGNVAFPHLGMSDRLWDSLTNSVDAVINCAARIHHTEIYTNNDSNRDARAVNVGGIKNILEFACENRLKHVFHAGTFLAASKVREGVIAEGWPEDVGDFDFATSLAYPITKFVSEMLFKEAAKRGIPCKVFRFPIVTGNSKTGKFCLNNNHVMLRYISILTNGAIPSSPMPMPMLPIDQCAEISMKIFFHDKGGQSDLYNITHPNVDIDQEFVQVAKRFGKRVSLVDDEEFAKSLERDLERGTNFGAFKNYYVKDQFWKKYRCHLPLFKFWRPGNDGYFVSKKLETLMPDIYDPEERTMDYVYKDLKFAKNNGWF